MYLFSSFHGFQNTAKLLAEYWDAMILFSKSNNLAVSNYFNKQQKQYGSS